MYYKDLASAVAAAAPQSTVTLIDNTTVEKSVKLDNEDVLTIDLNGKTLEAPNGTAINMSNGGELTLVNGTVNSKDYAVYAAQDAVIHELNIDMNAGFWGVYLGENAVLEKVTGGTYKSNDASESNFSLYVTSNAKIGEISGGDFQGSKAAIANYGTIEKISGGTFHGTYYDGTNATIWEPQYSVMYDGNIGSITGGTFFKGEKNIAQNMPKFNAALTAGGTTLVELPDTSTIAYKKSGTILTEYTGHYYKVSKTDKAYVETVFGERVTYTTDNKITSLSVATADELLLLNDLDLAKVISHGEGNPCKITITNDIDMSGATWRAMHGQFVTIDGQGHTISNLNCTQGTSGKAGFISYLGAGKITNLTLNNVTASGCQAGAFAGQLEDGTIENCVLKGTVTITWEQCSGTYNEVYNAIGALVGWKNSGTVGTVDVTGATIQLVKDGMEAETSDTAKAYWTADNNLVGAIMR